MKYQAASIPEWFSKGSVYQINPRTFSSEGTIEAVTEQLPFLADLGFSIMYLCPIFSEDDSTDRKNWSRRQLASNTENPKNPYRMNDYFEIDSEYGTMDDLREFVNESHRLGMRVLLDLVYYHIGPNAPILKEHPEFAKQDNDGNIILGEWNFPVFDYNCQGLREYLYCNMVYYVGEIGVDGFRCDVGDNVPLDFWAEGLKRIRAIKPDSIIINEGVKWEYLTVFHAIYAYHWHECIYNIISEKDSANSLRDAWVKYSVHLPIGGKFLRDMENHDMVTDWNNRVENMIGHNGMELVQVLNYIIDGIPMVYCGNELGDTAKLSMFANRFYMGKFEVTDRSIAKENYSIRRQNIIKELNEIRKTSEILCSGETVWLDNTEPKKITSFARVLRNEKIVFIGNMSKDRVECKVSELTFDIKEKLFESEEKTENINGRFIIPPYGYIVLKY